MDWKKIEKEIRTEAERGPRGRFGPGPPHISDGSMLFLLHLVSKMKPAEDGGSRAGIILHGSALFGGGAGSGESEIRRHVLENDLVEAIIALPAEMFHNTPIGTYLRLLSNRKPERRQGKVQLIDASGFWRRTARTQGHKRRELDDEHIAEIARLFRRCRKADQDGVPVSRVFKNADFGYRTIIIERPLLDAEGNNAIIKKGELKDQPKPDPDLRETVNVPLGEDLEEYLRREVIPHAPGAWIDHEKTKVGYAIPFRQHFHVHPSMRDLAMIDAERKEVTERIVRLIGELPR